VQDLIEQIWCCALIGCALSLVVATAWSQPVRFTMSSILPRILLVGVPAYLGVNYLLYQDTLLIAGAGTSFASCLYWLRGWWFPGHRSGAASGRPLMETGKRRAALASTVLRHRLHRVVRDDRQLAKAA
jgi:hypothetical protein